MASKFLTPKTNIVFIRLAGVLVALNQFVEPFIKGNSSIYSADEIQNMWIVAFVVGVATLGLFELGIFFYKRKLNLETNVHSNSRPRGKADR